MPELPEVETIRVALEPLLRGRVVVDAGAHPSAKFAAAPEAVGYRVEGVRRRGKYLLVDLVPGDDGGRGPSLTAGTARPEHAEVPRPPVPAPGRRTQGDDLEQEGPDGAPARELVVHLGMTGQLGPDLAPDDPYARAWWGLDDGTHLTYRDVRRFGRIAVVPRGDHGGLPTLAALGPEPFGPDFTPEGLWRALGRSRAQVKTQLLGQRVVAGVGNIYADEALWRAGIHPGSRRVGRERAARLHGAVREALAAGLANGGTTLRDYRTVNGEAGRNQHALACYGRAGRPCLRCDTVLRRAVLDARGTTWCPTCQRP